MQKHSGIMLILQGLFLTSHNKNIRVTGLLEKEAELKFIAKNQMGWFILLFLRWHRERRLT